MSQVPASIFRAYDIRGVVGDTLTPEIVIQLGKALASEAAARGENTLVVARDGRVSGPAILEALKEGIMSCGLDVIDIGLVPTPVLYYAAMQLEGTNSGIMVTGSHNPPDYNGFKCVLAGKTLAGEEITQLYERIQQQDFISGEGFAGNVDIKEDYLNAITERIKPAKPLKLVVDTGNGAAGELAPKLLKLLGCEVKALFSEIDGTFPNHHPDPSNPENLASLIEEVESTGADLGLAFDGDGDRLGVITPSGRLIYPDHLMMAFAEDLLSRHSGARIIYDVKCTGKLAQVISAAGGIPEMSPTGHSLIKAKMQATGALLAGEMSGHIFFKENWFGFDDALFSAAKLVEILAQQDVDADEFFNRYPQNISTPEINLDVTDENKFTLVQQLIEQGKFGDGEISTLDGIRVDYADGWGLCRASNTTPKLVLRFEGTSQAALDRIAATFAEQLTKVDSELQLDISAL